MDDTAVCTASAATREEEADKQPFAEALASEIIVDAPAEDTTGVNPIHSTICEDCGLTFEHPEDFKTHLHQHALEEEENKDAQTGDNMSPGAESNSRKDAGEDGDEDTAGDAEESEMLQPKPSTLMRGVGVSKLKSNLHKVYPCLICGKVYTYLVSFRKHQQQHESKPPVRNETNYECPECGMSFIRHARLRGHLRKHELGTLDLFSCDSGDTEFTPLKSLMPHTEPLDQKAFWCLSCSTGFSDEQSLDIHLQGHGEKQHTCSICQQSFNTAAQLQHHCKTHNKVKPYPCTLCGKSFALHGNFLRHRKTHLSGIRAKKRLVKKKVLFLNRIREEPETNELQGEVDFAGKSENRTPLQDEENPSDESDCGEPLHCSRPLKPPGSTGPDPATESQVGQELHANMHVHREHKYWEWECCECDMGFDEMSKLHLHYIKHATGELPILMD